MEIILQAVQRKPFLLQQTAESECLNYNDIVRYFLLFISEHAIQIHFEPTLILGCRETIVSFLVDCTF